MNDDDDEDEDVDDDAIKVASTGVSVVAARREDHTRVLSTRVYEREPTVW